MEKLLRSITGVQVTYLSVEHTGPVFSSINSMCRNVRKHSESMQWSMYEDMPGHISRAGYPFYCLWALTSAFFDCSVKIHLEPLNTLSFAALSPDRTAETLQKESVPWHPGGQISSKFYPLSATATPPSPLQSWGCGVFLRTLDLSPSSWSHLTPAISVSLLPAGQSLVTLIPCYG